MVLPRVLRARLLAVTVAALALAPAVAPAASAASPSPSASASANPSGAARTKDVTFGVQPASATAPDGRPFFTFGATPGARLTDHVAILNFSFVPLTLTVYATDALNTAEGGYTLLEAKKKPTDAGAWLAGAMGRRTVVVPARRSANSPAGQVILPVTMVIPANASPGDHGAGIIASLSTVTKNAQGANIILDQRVASRVYVRVAGQVHPRLAIEDLSATYHGTLNPFGRGFVTVTYTVHNRGNVKLGGEQAVEVSGWFGGTEQAPKMVDIPLLFPGASVRVSVDVPGVLPSIRGTATATVVPLMLSGDVDPGLAVRVTDSVGFWAVPWPLLVLVLCLVLLLGAWWYRRRHAAPASADEPDEPVRAKPTAGVAS